MKPFNDERNYKLKIKEASYYTCCILNITSIQGLHTQKNQNRIYLHIYFVIYSLLPKEKLLDRRICPGGSYFWTFIAPIKVLLRMKGRTYIVNWTFCSITDKKDWFSDISISNIEHIDMLYVNLNQYVQKGKNDLLEYLMCHVII